MFLLILEYDQLSLPVKREVKDQLVFSKNPLSKFPSNKKMFKFENKCKHSILKNIYLSVAYTCFSYDVFSGKLLVTGVTPQESCC